MEQLRPRTSPRLPAMARLLAAAGIVCLVGAPHGAHASQSWDGPVLKRVGGAPSIQAQSDPAPLSGIQNTSGSSTAVTRSADTAGASNGAAGAPASNATAGGTGSSARVTTTGPQGGSATGAIGDRQAATGNADTGGAAAKTATGGGGTAQPTAKSGAASPTLNLPVYAPVSDSGGQSLDGPTIAGLVFKFLAVLALLFIVLRVLKAIMPGGRGKRAGRDQPLLLHSESIGDKQRILLLDFGGKLVAAGVAGTTMTTLATIEDAEAVDTIRARYAPLAEAVPGYQEAKTPTPLSQSFMETLKRAGIVGQRQTGWGPATPITRAPAAPADPVAPATPTISLTRRDTGAAGAGNGRRTIRGAEGAMRPTDQPVEPILHEALEAMRAVRRRVEGA